MPWAVVPAPIWWNKRRWMCCERTCQTGTFLEHSERGVRTQGAFGRAGDPLSDPTVALRHKVVVYTHHPLRRWELLTHTWHRASSAEHKDGTCLGVCHARVSRTEACPDLPQNHAVFVVEMGGIEPPSNGRPRILLRAQSTVLFLSPQHCVDTPPDRLS